jgi:hypothetical protein
MLADIARDGVEARGGELLELRDDEALCVFSSARDAIRAAVWVPLMNPVAANVFSARTENVQIHP